MPKYDHPRREPTALLDQAEPPAITLWPLIGPLDRLEPAQLRSSRQTRTERKGLRGPPCVPRGLRV